GQRPAGSGAARVRDARREVGKDHRGMSLGRGSADCNAARRREPARSVAADRARGHYGCAGVEARAGMGRTVWGAATAALPACVPVAASAGAQDFAYDILPPGQYGGLPTNAHSTDQLPLYD